MDPKPYAERLAEILNRLTLLDDICAYIANGGSVIDFAQALDVRYSDLAQWWSADKVRAGRISQALEQRDEWMKHILLREIGFIARVDLRDAYNEDGSLKNIKEMPEHVARAIAAVEVDELWAQNEDGPGKHQAGWTKKVKFWNKDKAIETLGKQVGLFNPVQKHHVSTSLEDLVAGSKDQSAA